MVDFVLKPTNLIGFNQPSVPGAFVMNLLNQVRLLTI